MNTNEMKEAMLRGCNVVHNGIVYECISAMIFRMNKGHVVASAELISKQHRSSRTTVLGKDIKSLEEYEKELQNMEVKK